MFKLVKFLKFHPDKMPDEIIDVLSPEIRELLQQFTAPYEQRAPKVLMQ